jgi:hypothetical protein
MKGSKDKIGKVLGLVETVSGVYIEDPATGLIPVHGGFFAGI